MTDNPNPADLRPAQIAEVEALFAAFPDPRITEALRQARLNVGLTTREGEDVAPAAVDGGVLPAGAGAGAGAVPAGDDA